MSDNLKKAVDAEIQCGKTAEQVIAELRKHACFRPTAQAIVDEVAEYLAGKAVQPCN